MSRLHLSPEEFALLAVVVERTVGFIHNDQRELEELRAFRAEIYPYLRKLNYDVIGCRFSDTDREAINELEADLKPIPAEVSAYSQLISGWHD